MRPFAFQGLRLRPHRRAAPYSVKYVAEAQTVGQLYQRLHVMLVGPDPAFCPTPYGVAIGPQAAGNLRRR